MSVFQNIKKKYRNYFFRKATSKRNRQKQVINYYEAKKIGIIYDASKEEDYILIANLTKELQMEGKKVNTIGYIRQKKRPDYSFPRLIFGFFFKHDFTWDYKPKSNFIKDFLEKEYDILLDLSPEEIFLAKYIAGLSRAKYKVGIFSKDYLRTYDLMIEVDDSCSLKQCIGHSLHYLKNINIQKTYA